MTRVYVFMFVFLCVFEHLFACVCIRVFELREIAREFVFLFRISMSEYNIGPGSSN